MNIVVVGSKGTIGTPLTRALKTAGHNVFEIDLQHQKDELYFRADISNYRELSFALQRAQSLIGDIDLVVNLAAEFGRHNGELFYDRLWRSNAIGNKNLLSLQQEGMFDKYMHFSSSEVYGEIKSDFLYEDIMNTHPVKQNNDYAVSKWVNEVQITNHKILTGLPVMVVRLFNAYGREEYYHPFRSVVCLFCYNALRNKPYNIYEGYHRVFMHIDDLIPTLVNACTHFIPGETVNIGGREFRSVQELSNVVLGYLGKTEAQLGVKVLPEDTHNTVNKRPDISKAEKLFGHNPVITIETGVPDTIEWMKKAYNL